MNMTYDEKSFILNGKRIWLANGEVHYFRHPREGWRDVLLRAKRAGLNSISTYIPWNYHEPEKGKYDLSGDKDVGHFIDLAGELGLYVMIRPGPYICSEWDGGGIPAWVSNIKGIRTREDDPRYMEVMEAWFERLLPVLQPRQVSRGGPIITIQNENEYCGGWDDSTRSYIKKITAMFKKYGFDIPVLGCNVHAAANNNIQINGKTNPEDQMIDKDMVLTYNCGTNVNNIYELKRRQPYAPAVVTELWSGIQSMWGRFPNDWPEKTLQTRVVYDFTASGAQVCYYMFEGGTNFGYWAGEYIATSYQSAYPVGDGGVLRDKYYMLKQVNHFITGFGDFLAESEELPAPEDIEGPGETRMIMRKSNRGAILFVSLADKRKNIEINLANHKTMDVCFGEVAASALPVSFEALPGIVLDYANMSLFNCIRERNIIMFYGVAGTEGVFSINGKECAATIRHNDIAVLKTGEATILVVDEKMARRFWDVEGHLFFGPDFAGEQQKDGTIPLRTSAATEKVFYINRQGDAVPVSFTVPLHKYTPPVFSSWKAKTCSELSKDDINWSVLARPQSHEDLGIDFGYVWYKATLESEREEVRQLCFTNTPNRVSVFVNGSYCGTYGEKRTKSQRLGYEHPVDFYLENITVPLMKGKNDFVFLSDNQGHDYGMFIPKGITGPVFAGTRRLGMNNVACLDPVPVSQEAYRFLYCVDYKKQVPLPAIEFDLELRPGERGYITLHDIPSWITVDGQELAPMIHPLNIWNMWSHASCWCNYLMPVSEKGGRYKIKVAFRFKPYQYVLDKLQCFAVTESEQLKEWAYKPFNENVDFTGAKIIDIKSEKKSDNLVLLLPSLTGGAPAGHTFTPSFFETSFPMPEGDQPVFLSMGEMQKGQLYLNGHNIGRFWQVGGTNTRYYLPREWMKEENRLVIFEELGMQPGNTTLVFGDEQPASSELLFKPGK